MATAIATNSTVGKAHLRRLFRGTRQSGYSISDEEMDIGSIGIAAPVRNGKGDIIAALNVAAISSRHSDAENELAPLVIEYADRISGKLGGYGRRYCMENSSRLETLFDRPTEMKTDPASSVFEADL